MRARLKHVAALALALGFGWQASAQAEVYKAEAYGVKANLLGLIPIGPLPESKVGPAADAQATTLIPLNLPNILQLGVLNTSAVGSGSQSFANANTLGLNLTLGPVAIGASVLNASSTSTCNATPQGTGSSYILGLTINGNGQVISGMPNQTIEIVQMLSLVKIVINEQITEADGSFTVNALHVKLLSVLGVLQSEVIVSHANTLISDCSPPPPTCPDPTNPDCPINCPGDARCPCPNPMNPDCPTCPVKDFVTGGGWVVKDGKKVSFSTHGGVKNDGTLWNGHLNVKDHGTGAHIQDSSFYGYTISGDTKRILDFTCTGALGTTCQVTVNDKGEPGNANAGGIDTWLLKSPANGTCATAKNPSGAYCAGSDNTNYPIAGGNIQLHKVKDCQPVTYTTTTGGTGGGKKGGGPRK